MINDCSSSLLALFTIDSNSTETKIDKSFLPFLVIEILDVFGFSLDDYEGECEIYARNFISAGRTMGYDYIGLSQNFIGSFA